MKKTVFFIILIICTSGAFANNIVIELLNGSVVTGPKLKVKYKGNGFNAKGGELILIDSLKEKTKINFEDVASFKFGSWTYDMRNLFAHYYSTEDSYPANSPGPMVPFLKLLCYEDYILYYRIYPENFYLSGEPKDVNTPGDRRYTIPSVGGPNSPNGESRISVTHDYFLFHGDTCKYSISNGGKNTLKVFFKKCDAVQELVTEAREKEKRGYIRNDNLTVKSGGNCACGK